MPGKIMTKTLCAVAAGVAMVVLAASSQAQPPPPRPAINYNASKSNTGNLTNSPATPCPDGTSKTAAGACPPGGGATSPTTATTYPSLHAHSHDPLNVADPNSGMATGKRQH